MGSSLIEIIPQTSSNATKTYTRPFSHYSGGVDLHFADRQRYQSCFLLITLTTAEDF